MTRKPLAEIVAAAIRDAIPDEDQCLDDEEACYELHPIHPMSSVDGVVDMVYMRVDDAANLIADALVGELEEVAE